MELSICIITKNECEMLKKCLESLSPFDCEIVVVDTGSTDETKDMASQFTNSIYDFEWIDDFAAAKNYSISKAKYDTVMIVDSDEYFISGSIEEFFELSKKYPNAAGEIHQIEYVPNERGGLEERRIGLARVFDRRVFHYGGKIHERLVEGSVFDPDRNDTRDLFINKSGERSELYDTGLLFGHDGYSGEGKDRVEKARRNVELLKKELESYPDSPDLVYQTAKSVYVAYGPEEALPYYERALGLDLNIRLFWVVDLIICYGYLLLELERYDQALSLEAVYDDLIDSTDYIFLMGLIHMNNAMFDTAIKEFLRCTTMGADKSVGTNSYKAYYNAGVIEECMGHIDRAKEYYVLAGEYEPALKGLERIGA